jgi:hypothetical protein
MFKHDPANGIYGDCWRTVIACLLDKPVDTIQHEHKPYDGGEQTAIVRGYLQGLGLDLFTIAYEIKTLEDVQSVMDIMQANNPRVYYMMSGMSRTGVNHVVICKGDKIVHDTSLTNSGIIGPQDNGQLLIEIIVGLGAL